MNLQGDNRVLVAAAVVHGALMVNPCQAFRGPTRRSPSTPACLPVPYVPNAEQDRVRQDAQCKVYRSNFTFILPSHTITMVGFWSPSHWSHVACMRALCGSCRGLHVTPHSPGDNR